MTEKEEQEATVRGIERFSSHLYNILAKKNGNVFFSPISAHAVLSMAYQGAKGETHEALTTTLNVSSSDLAAKGYKNILEQLNNVSDIELSMANKLYIMKGMSLKPVFKDITQKRFLSDVEPVNFSDAVNAAKNINHWVEEKTMGKIKDLIQHDTLNAITRLVLINAIYFKGNWANKFNAKATKTDKFYLNDQDFVDVPIMNNQEDYLYMEDENLDAKILGMPYSNPHVHLFIFLPNKRNGIAELEKKLALSKINEILEEADEMEVEVKLPKFKIESTIELNEPLGEMGLGIIFDESHADFSEMLTSSEKLYVSQVIQKAFIEVNEEGTEAAAATGMMISFYSAPLNPSPPKIFRADHPFFILLKIENPNVVPLLLFAGRISNPK